MGSIPSWQHLDSIKLKFERHKARKPMSNAKAEYENGGRDVGRGANFHFESCE